MFPQNKWYRSRRHVFLFRKRRLQPCINGIQHAATSCSASVPEAPYMGTGMEYKAARDSGVMVLAKRPGVVERVTADEIWVRHEEEVDGKFVKGDIGQI